VRIIDDHHQTTSTRPRCQALAGGMQHFKQIAGPG
jgi:hypothetical protein